MRSSMHRGRHRRTVAVLITTVCVAALSTSTVVHAVSTPPPVNFDSPSLSSVTAPGVERAGLYSLTQGDFTGSGRVDMAAVAFGGAVSSGTSDPGVVVFLQAGDGSFASPVEYAAGGFPIEVVSGHLRGPKAPLDLVVQDAGTDANGVATVAVLLGNGDGTFAAPRLIEFPGAGVGAVGVGDLNGDGWDDLVVNTRVGAATAGSTVAENLTVLLSNGDGTFQPAVPYQAGDAASFDTQINVVDVNHDGTADVLALDSDGLWLSLGNGDGSLRPGAKFWSDPTAGQTGNLSGPSSFTTGDLTGAGNVDIALQVGGIRVDVLRNSGAGAFAPSGVYDVSAQQTGFGGGTVAAADLTGSGRLDLLTTTGFGATLAVLRNQGNGLFATTPLYSPLPSPDDGVMMVAPLGSDHLPDVVAATSIGGLAGDNNYLTTLRNRGDGTFAAPRQYPVVAPYDSPKVNHTNPIGVATGDFNGDGHPDMVVTEWDTPIETLTNGQLPTPPTINAANGTVDNGGSIAVFLNKGDGTLGAETQYRVGARPIAVVAADLTGNGQQDLAVVNAFSGTLSLLKGNGDGTFQAAVTIPMGKAPNALAIADLNGDGKPDIVATQAGDNTVAVLLNHSIPGTFSFAAPVTYPTGQVPDAVVTGHFTTGGHIDLAVAAYGDVSQFSASTLSVLRGNGDGTFSTGTPQVLTSFPGVDALVAGDFTGTGRHDLAYAQFQTGSVGLLRNNQDGSFTPTQTYKVGAGPESMVARDFNGDGTPDLAVDNINDNSVAMLLGQGDGTFVPVVDSSSAAPRTFGWVAGAYPTYLAAADLTGTGRLDLVTGNIFNATITVLHNTTPVPGADVPEAPGAALLLAAGGGGGLWARRRGTRARGRDLDAAGDVVGSDTLTT